MSGYWSSLAPTNSLGKLQVRTQIVMKCVVILFKLSVFEQHLEENYLENKSLKIFFLLCQTVPLSRLGKLLSARELLQFKYYLRDQLVYYEGVFHS